MPKTKMKPVPMEISWALEKIAQAQYQIEGGGWAAAASFLDIARLHLEEAALRQGQSLHPRTEAAQRLSKAHDAQRPKPL